MGESIAIERYQQSTTSHGLLIMYKKLTQIQSIVLNLNKIDAVKKLANVLPVALSKKKHLKSFYQNP